ncbi:isocitrate lyase/phosphoenolpyruvate mutase family protein [Streptomyces acidiscabies]|uniref:isocitrate lyase/phosphoenolpyruvate mutase family protein n=1 Tax=Streptomyces acidiscabies TaxID=42234 RepID=UPI000B31E30B|nr:isocitrate lyase/phosphoenolpyruvate mutase family protein [Streptomyces acidiscabies]
MRGPSRTSRATGDEFFVIARTEALINGLGVDVALDRAHAYAYGGADADAVLIHSKKSTDTEVVEFVKRWEGRLPVVVVPTTYPDWNIAEAEAMGVQVVIYANQGMRATISSLRETYRSTRDAGDTVALEPKIASVADRRPDNAERMSVRAYSDAALRRRDRAGFLLRNSAGFPDPAIYRATAPTDSS